VIGAVVRAVVGSDRLIPEHLMQELGGLVEPEQVLCGGIDEYL